MSHDASTREEPTSWINRAYPELTPAGRDGLTALANDPARALIAVDFDGTLAPIVPDPEQARALPAAVEALRELTPRIATMAVLTGRPALTAVECRFLDQIPGIVRRGSYGRRRWPQGQLQPAPP